MKITPINSSNKRWEQWHLRFIQRVISVKKDLFRKLFLQKIYIFYIQHRTYLYIGNIYTRNQIIIIYHLQTIELTVPFSHSPFLLYDDIEKLHFHLFWIKNKDAHVCEIREDSEWEHSENCVVWMYLSRNKMNCIVWSQQEGGFSSCEMRKDDDWLYFCFVMKHNTLISLKLKWSQNS